MNKLRVLGHIVLVLFNKFHWCTVLGFFWSLWGFAEVLEVHPKKKAFQG